MIKQWIYDMKQPLGIKKIILISFIYMSFFLSISKIIERSDFINKKCDALDVSSSVLFVIMIAFTSAFSMLVAHLLKKMFTKGVLFLYLKKNLKKTYLFLLCFSVLLVLINIFYLFYTEKSYLYYSLDILTVLWSIYFLVKIEQN